MFQLKNFLQPKNRQNKILLTDNLANIWVNFAWYVIFIFYLGEGGWKNFAPSQKKNTPQEVKR